jgi:hypothetical protein
VRIAGGNIVQKISQSCGADVEIVAGAKADDDLQRRISKQT